MLYITLLPGQQTDMRFKHLTIDDGLSQNWVKCIIQDHEGFMWFGTGGNGLNRYDGYDFKVYKNSPNDKETLTNNWINILYIDKDKRLWVGTQHGLNYYDRDNDKFIRFPAVQSDFISGIFELSSKLYVVTAGNIYEVNFQKKELKSYIDKDRTNFPQFFRTCEKYKDGKILIGSAEGLYIIDLYNNTHIVLKHNENDPNSLSNNFIQCIYKDSKERIWLSTLSGLNLLVEGKGRADKLSFKVFINDPNDENTLNNGTIWSILDDRKGKLLLGIENGGLDIMDLRELEKGKYSFKHIKKNIFDGSSLSDNSINVLYKDNQGTIWIGTYSGGLNYYNKLMYKFEHRKSAPNIKNSLISNTVNTFFEDDNDLWIGTEGGISILDKTKGSYKSFSNDPHNPKSIGSNSIWSIFKDSRNNIWIGTWAGGLNLYNKSSQTFSHFYSDPKNPTSLYSNNIFEITEGKDGYIWLATMGGGLSRYDFRTNKFKAYRCDYTGKNSISGDWVQTIFLSSDNELWVSTTDGVDLFNIETEWVTNFKHDTANPNSISYNGANLIFEDSKKNIWIGTDGGLNLFIRKDSSFICYRDENGLPDNSIKGICEDDDYNLWLSTNNGISKFLNGVNHPDTPVFKNYDKSDGLQANEFNRHAYFKGKNGTIYFGGINGFNFFCADSLIENPHIPNVVLTDLLIFNKPVEIKTDGSPLVKQLSQCNEISLSYSYNVFTIKYSALNYISPEKNQFAYILEGFDKEWNYLGNKREATYTNLAPGTYIFRVKASNNDGIWNEKGTSLKIYILPAWWQTIWFRLVLILVIIGVLVLLYLYKMQNLKKQKIYLEKQVQERTKEIEEKNSMLQQQTFELNKTNIILKEKNQYIEEQNELLLEQTSKLNESNALLEKRQQLIQEQAEELQATADELLFKNNQLVNVNATKDKFFTIIAHDLKNPFTVIMGFSELLSMNFKKYDDNKKTSIIDTIHTSSKKYIVYSKIFYNGPGRKLGPSNSNRKYFY